MLTDAVAGAASGLVTGAVDKVVGAVAATGDVTFRSEVTTIRGFIRVPGKPGEIGILLDPGRTVTLPGNPIGNWVQGVLSGAWSSLVYRLANDLLGNWVGDMVESTWESANK
jgi:hypothetical protein